MKILDKYSNDTELIHKIIVTSYLAINKISVDNNVYIKSLILTPDQIQSVRNLHNIDNINVTTLDDMIEVFEMLIPKNDVVTNGAVYTPKYIKQYIISKVISYLNRPLKDCRISDISCGCGGFIFELTKTIKNQTKKSYSKIFSENIYGLDVCQYSVERAKILLSLLAITDGEDEYSFNFNLQVGNALKFNWNSSDQVSINNEYFDAIIGNPPYVRAKHIDKETKSLLKDWNVTKSGNPDLYIPFFEIGLTALKPNGILGYITVNTFYTSVNARELRKYLASNGFNLEIIDLGGQKIFRNKSTYNCICFVVKEENTHLKYAKATASQIADNVTLKTNKIPFSSLNNQKGWLLSTDKIIYNINKIQNCGKTLDELYKIKNGIATLANNIFIFNPIYETEKHYLINYENKLYSIEKQLCRDIIKPNIIKSEKDLFAKMEKLLFPYHIENNKLTPFKENYFKQEYPLAYEYLLEQKDDLLKRDKGINKKYDWYLFGRTQALLDHGSKILFPYMSNKPLFVITQQKDLLLYCGYAIYCEDVYELKILKKILESNIFWYYLVNTSKPYANGYYSFAKNYVKNFSVCELSSDEKEYVITASKDELDKFLRQKYGLK